MKQRFYSLFMLVLLSMAAVAAVPFNRMRRAPKAEPAVVYTLEAVQGSHNVYATYKDVVVNNMTWNVPGNQSLGNYWRIGGKSLSAEPRTITGKTPLNATVNRIVIHHNGVSRKEVSVDGVMLEVAEDPDFVTIVDNVRLVPDVDNTNTGIADSIVIAANAAPWKVGCYYRFTFYISNTNSSNGGLDFVNAVFYGEAGAEPLPWKPVTVQLNPASAEAIGWEQIYLWAWVTTETTSTNLFDMWPGIPVLIDEETGWYSYTVEEPFEGNLNIIWSNGMGSSSNQTVDIPVSGSTCYEVSALTDAYGNRYCNLSDCPNTVIPSQPTIDVVQAKAIGDALAVDTKSDTTYNIVGYVSSIKENAFYESYANMTFYIDDVLGGDDRFYVYRGKPAVELQVGDKISVKSKIYNYKGIIESESNTQVTLLEKAANEPLMRGVYDLSVMDTVIDKWIIEKAAYNASASLEKKYVYDISANYTATAYMKDVPDIRFLIRNGSDKAKAFNVFPGKYYEFGGKNGVIALRNTQAGDRIIITAAAKGDKDASFEDPEGQYPKNATALTQDLTLPAKNIDAEGADKQGYIWRDIEYISTGGDVRIKEFASGYRVRAITITQQEQIDTTQILSVAQASVFCNTLPVNQATPNSIAVAGYVVEVSDFDMTFNNQTFFIADDPQDNTHVLQAYRATPRKDNEPYPVLPGDYVVLRGPLQRYVNAAGEQFYESYSPSVEFLEYIAGERALPEVPVFTVAQALQRGYSMTRNHYSRTTYDIQGYVSNIQENTYSTYGSMTFWMSDQPSGASSNAEGAFLAYRAKVSEEFQLGDFVNIRTNVQNYSINNGADSIIESIAGAQAALLYREPKDTLPSAIPNEQYLINAGYDLTNNIVLCFNFTGEAEVCNEIVLAGAYNNWTSSTSEMLSLAPLQDFEGWYIVQLPYSDASEYANQAKPVQLLSDSSFLWDYQAGDIYAWIHRGGLATDFEDYAEECTPFFNAPGAYIYEITYWKNHASPCNVVPVTPQTIAVNCAEPMEMTYYESTKDWYLTAHDSTYFITLDFFSSNPQSPAGIYTENAFDYIYTQIYDATTYTQLTTVSSAVAQVVETGDSILVNATLLGNDGNTYIVYMYTPKPKAQRQVDVIASNLNILNEEGAYHISAYNDSVSVSFELYADSLIGTFERGETLFGVIVDGYVSMSMYDASISITETEGVYTLTGYALCLNNTQYNFYLRSPKQQPDTTLAPTAADLANAGYDLENNVVLCVNFTAEATVCNDIYFVGTFSNWETNFDNCPKFAPLAGFEGWYVAQAPYTDGFQGKPIQARANGSFSWENQGGDPDAWTYIAGNYISLQYGVAGEANMYYYSPGEYIYEMSYWKNHADLCNEEVAETVLFYMIAPKNAPQEGVEVIGTFDNWNGTRMEQGENNTFTATVSATANDVFKFRKAGDEDWMEEIMYWDSESYTWYRFPNLSFANYWEDGSEYNLPGYKVVLLNFSDSTYYRWTSDIPYTPDTTAQLDPLCAYIIDLEDTYGDGWNDASLTIIDGPVQMNYTLYSGAYERVYVPYYGNEVSFVWNAGNYDSEVQFTILTGNGIGLFYHPANTSLVNGETLYVMKTSPCMADLNPFIPQNLDAVITEDFKLRVTWDAVPGIAAYRLSIHNPQGVEITNNATVTGTSYLTDVLRMNGEYIIRVLSVDENGMQLAENTIYTEVFVPSIPSVTVQTFAPSDCNMDVSGGLWLVWNASGDTAKHIIPMATADNHLFVATFEPNAPSYDYYLINKPSLNADSIIGTGRWINRTESEHCSEILCARPGSWHNLRMSGYCEFKDHNYAISNLQAASYPGRVEFSWDAQDIEDTYYLYIWDTDLQTGLDTIIVTNAKTYTWAVDDQFDGMTVRWSVYPVEPYEHQHQLADSAVVLQKGTASNSYANASTADNKTLDMAWQFSSENLRYLVEIEYGQKIFKREIVTAKEYHYAALLPLTYDAYVTPLNWNNEVVGARVYAGSVYLSEVPEYVTDMESRVNGRNVTFSWKTAAPKVKTYLYLYTGNGNTKFISNQDLTDNTVSFDVEEDGTYGLSVIPYIESEPGVYVYSDYWYRVMAQVYTSNTFPVTINATEGGYIYPYGLSGDYAEGSVLDVWAYAIGGYYFDGWSNGAKESNLSIYVDDTISLTAYFKPYLTLRLNQSEGGEIAINTSEFIATDSSKLWLKEGQTYILTAFPEEGYEFVQWQDGLKSIERIEVMTADAEFTAIFQKIDPTKQKFYVHVYLTDAAQGYVTPYSALITEGTTIEINAIPADGYEFVCWSDSVTTTPRQLVINKNYSIYPIFALKKVNLRLEAGLGGSVNSAEADSIYDFGSEVLIKATPDEGYHFLTWSDGNKMAERYVILTQDTLFKAEFEQDSYFKLDLRAENGGKVRVSGQTEWSTAYLVDCNPTKLVTIEAKADDGYVFVQWSDGETDSVRTFFLDKDTLIAASFAPVYKLTVMASAGGAVEVSGNYTLFAPSVYLFAAGEKAVLTAKPDEGYLFTGWDDLTKSRVREITMTGDKMVFAAFQSAADTPQRSVTIGVQGNGLGAVSYVEPFYYQGESFTVTATPEPGYRFIAWSDSVTENPRTVEVGDADIAFNAIFAGDTYKLTISVDGNGGTVNDSVNAKEYMYGDFVFIEAKADSNYHFLRWSDGNRNAYRRIVITDDIELKAIFEGDLYTIAFINYNDSVIEISQFPYGTIPVCSVTPEKPADEKYIYTFAGWEPELAPVTGDAIYMAVFTAQATAYTVTFYDWNLEIISEQLVAPGMAAVVPPTPVREGYIFNGWKMETEGATLVDLMNVQSDLDVIATYRPAEEGLEEIISDLSSSTTKLLIDGQIYIIRDNKLFTLTGQKVK